MKKLYLSFLLVFIGLGSFSQSFFNKSNFDDNCLGSHNRLKSGKTVEHRLAMDNGTIEVTLMRNGYFTIGTKNGISELPFDDNCQITYGHPYALTSFPLLVIDGVEHSFQSYFANSPQTLNPGQGNSLLIESTNTDGINAVFSMSLSEDNSSIGLNFSVTNSDKIAHRFALGLMLDPALGKYGDGALYLSGNLLEKKTTITENIPESIEIWENSSKPKGLGLAIDFGENNPAQLMVDNWFQMNNHSVHEIEGLYDLALKSIAEELVLNPNESISFTVKIELLRPDFDEGLLLRWDMPQFLSIENNVLFPSEFVTSVDAMNLNNQSMSIELAAKSNELLNSQEPSENITIAGLSSAITKVSIEFYEIYESQIVPLELAVYQKEDEIQSFTRNVFIPASPFSDVGLAVQIDTISLGGNTPTKVGFSVRNEETGMLIYDLKKTNLFFYADDVRQPSLLEKDTMGGVNQADIVFVLDVTGSMSGEIASVRDNIIEFSESLANYGIDYRIGMVTFLDEIENIYGFTSDVYKFRDIVSQQNAHGGGDGPENSLEGLMNATFFNFRPSANRTVIWITDAEYHNRTQYTLDDVIEGLLKKGITVNCIGTKSYQTDYYDQIVMNTGGKYFDINGNFRDILLEISKMPQSGKYFASWLPQESIPSKFTVEVHYAGLGGKTDTVLNRKKHFNTIADLEVSSFPNPFAIRTNIKISNLEKQSANVEIYNVSGQCIFNSEIPKGYNQYTIALDTENSKHAFVDGGLYILKVTTSSTNGLTSQKTSHLIYMK